MTRSIVYTYVSLNIDSLLWQLLEVLILDHSRRDHKAILQILHRLV